MYSTLQLAGKYLQYYRKAHNSRGHGMHSPFVFDFIQNVLQNECHYEAPSEIEALRKNLLRDHRKLEINDLGAGSRKSSVTHRTVNSIARTALKPAKYAQLLFRLAKHYQPATIIELGTSLGLTTSYFSKAVPAARIHTIEGSPAIAQVAQENFKALGLENVHAHTGHFDDVLPGLLRETRTADLGYIDGNHRYEPTIRYFREFLPCLHDHSILVFDDIHWSAEMEEAWAEIRQHPRVQYTIDIFYLGFVFFRTEFRVKQDFIIRY